MIKEERIVLREKIFNLFEELSIMISSRGHNKVNRNKLKRISENKELYILYNTYINEFRSEEEAIYCLTHNTDYTEHICPICSELSKFRSIRRVWSYSKTCGKRECMNKIIHSDIAKERAKQSFIKNYGVDNPAKNKEVIEKMKSTNKERYGSEYIVLTDSFKEKSKATCKKKYGVEYSFQSEDVRNKGKATCKEKYGVEYPSQNKDIRLKIETTNKERYGTKAPLQNKEVFQKLIKTNKERYGVSFVAQNPEIYKKVKTTNKLKYGTEIASQSDIVKSKARETYFNNHYDVNTIVNDNDIKEVLDILKGNKLIDIYSKDNLFIQSIELLHNKKNRLLRIREIANMFGIPYRTIISRVKELNLLNYFYLKDSKLELQFKKLLDDNNIRYTRHDKNILDGKEIDFLLDDYKIGFEINDIKSHNIMSKEPFYHINKTISSSNKGIRLIHIYEWELINKSIWNRLSR